MKKNKKTVFQKTKFIKNKNTDVITKPKLPFLKLFWISIGLGVINILIVFMLRPKLPPEVPLYYGLAEGNEQLSTNLELIIPGIIAVIITIINYFTAILVKDDFFQKVMVVAAFCVSFLSVITVVKIIFLVGSF